MLTFEQDQIQGADAIVGKLAVGLLRNSTDRARAHPTLFAVLQGLPFQKIQHRVSTMDAQPASTTEAAMVVLVTGQLLVSSPSCFGVASEAVPSPNERKLNLCPSLRPARFARNL